MKTISSLLDVISSFIIGAMIVFVIIIGSARQAPRPEMTAISEVPGCKLSRNDSGEYSVACEKPSK